jgi:hypothetical protein
LAEDREFWNRTADGLVALGAQGFFRAYRLQRTVSELVVVADSFHTKPLVRILQSAGRYQVLGLSRKSLRLFEGNRYTLDEIEPAPGVPRTITEALGEELTEPHQTVASYGGVGAGSVAMRHGHGGKEAEVDIDAERFFRAVDRGVLEHHSRPSSLPLILAALPEHHGLFRRVSHNPLLMDGGVETNPEALSSEELCRRAWQVVEPNYLERLSALVEEFGGAQSRGLAHGDLEQVARAVVAGRVATLLVQADREIPGRVDAGTGAVTFGDLAHPEIDDVLDDLGFLALKMGGQVIVVPAEKMPTETGAAAIYRY